MRELRSEVVNDRRVRLLVDQGGRYTVTIEVLGPQGAWEDISMVADPELHTASLCYRLRLTEQEARAIEWGAGRDPTEDTLSNLCIGELHWGMGAGQRDGDEYTTTGG